MLKNEIKNARTGWLEEKRKDMGMNVKENAKNGCWGHGKLLNVFYRVYKSDAHAIRFRLESICRQNLAG
ncbi:MAG: hypothetical protein MSD82_04300 [Prevotella sp.]|nr:hypothetical protein [Prevotella sp.]